MNALKIRLQMFYYRHKKVTDFKPHVKKSKRSFWGNVILGLFLIALACLFFFPVLYMISQSLKPMNEMFIFPPKIWVKNPTLDNYRDFFNVLANTVVPFARYMYNTVLGLQLARLVISCWLLFVPIRLQSINSQVRSLSIN